MTEYTRGPLTVDDSGNIFGPNGRLVANCAGWQNNREPARDENMANARLIKAAWVSYYTHCGERAVECAEGDLLGELWKALNHLVETADEEDAHPHDPESCEAHQVAWQIARTVLAKAKGVKP